MKKIKILIFSLSIFLIPLCGRAVVDISAPELTAFSVSPSTVDTTFINQTITITFSATDDFSGVGRLDMEMDPLNGGMDLEFGNLIRISGDELNGTYAVTAILPKGAEPGIWDVIQFSLSDNVGNELNLDRNALENQFGPNSAIFTNNATVSDIVRPSITGFSMTPLSVDTTSFGQLITATITTTDDFSGIKYIDMDMYPQGGGMNLEFGNLMRISGDELNGIYTISAFLPKGSKPGFWEVTELNIYDAADNEFYLYKNDIESQFGAGSATVNNEALIADTTAPALTDFFISSSRVDTSSVDQSLTITFNVTDDFSGINYVESEIAPTGEWNGIEFGNMTLISGNELSGSYLVEAILPKGSKAGFWDVNNFTIKDATGNYNNLYKTDIEALFGSGSATVINSDDVISPDSPAGLNVI